MGRLLLLGALAWIVWLIWQRLRGAPTPVGKEAASYQETVRCHTCGVHLSVDRAIRQESGDWLCPQHQSEETNKNNHSE
jgi:hypothetical protein